MRSDRTVAPVAAIVVALTINLSPAVAADERVSPAQRAARAAAAEFGATLTRTLTSAMAQGGPVAAINVCSAKAPRIADFVAAKHGVNVSRTSRRYRNPGNAPESWQQVVLEAWQASLEQGTEPATLEYFDDQATTGYRYMRPIMTQTLCLSCHGTNLDPPVSEAIQVLYPDDLARGYSVGELRGAFVVTGLPGATQSNSGERMP
jgi:hypothetical protein